MIPQAYRQLLSVPRVGTTVLLMFVARLPMTAMGMLMTLHVVTSLDRGYAAAGLVGTATTLGTATGAPLLGKLIDRHGARPVVLVVGVASAAFWVSIPHLPYPVLLALALPAGMVAIPVALLARQFLAALVLEDQRRAAFSLDAVSTEASFIIGPPAAIMVVVHISSTVALTGMGIWLALTATALYLTDLPTRDVNAPAEPAAHERRPRGWLDGRLAGALLIVVGALFALIGTELSVIAMLESNDETAWTGVVIASMAIASIVGGVLHGAVRRSFSQATLGLLLGLLLLPVGLFGQPWWLLAMALVPMNLVVTPTLAASTERISRLAPAEVRGTALGLLDSATRVGIALGAPVVGMAIDSSSAGWGFASAGLGGLVLTALGAVGHQYSSARMRRRGPSRCPPPAAPPPLHRNRPAGRPVERVDDA